MAELRGALAELAAAVPAFAVPASAVPELALAVPALAVPELPLAVLRWGVWRCCDRGRERWRWRCEAAWQARGECLSRGPAPTSSKVASQSCRGSG